MNKEINWDALKSQAAIAAMQTMIGKLFDVENYSAFAPSVAKFSVEYADALIAELIKEKTAPQTIGEKKNESGNSAKIGSSGDYAKIGSSGDYAKINSTGKNSVIMCAGHNAMAKAKIGSWITLAEWYRDETDNHWKPKCVKTEYVDGERIKEDTYYKLIDGEFKEVTE